MDPKTGQILTFDSEKELEKAMRVKKLIELTGIPKKSCKKCHGRGHTGYDTVEKEYIVCPCVAKERQKEIRENRREREELYLNH